MHILAIGRCASLVGTSCTYSSHFPLPHHLLPPLLFHQTHLVLLKREMGPPYQDSLLMSVRVDGYQDLSGQKLLVYILSGALVPDIAWPERERPRVEGKHPT